MFSDDSLLKADFDPVAFLKHTLHLPNVEAEHAKLQRCTDLIDGDIRSAVASNYEGMLHQVDATVRAVKETERLKSNVTTLSSALVRLHHTIETPFNTIQSTGTELRNASAALDTLRAVQKLLAAVSKLPDAAAAKTADIHRTARRIKEIDELLAFEGLSGIHVVDKALAEVTALSAATRARGQEMLRSGLASGRQTDTSTALHALGTLGVGGRVVVNYLAEAKRDALKCLIAIDAQHIATEVAEQSDIGAAKELVLAAVERALGEVAAKSSLVLLLLRTVQKQSAASTNATGLGAPSSAASSQQQQTLQEETAAAFADYGASVAAHVAERLTKLGKKANINGVLVTEFPRYSRAVARFAEQCEPLLILAPIAPHGHGHTAAAAPTPSYASGAQWQAKALEDSERLFASHVAERQRDRLQQVITRLNTLVPRQDGGGVAVDISVDPMHPIVPPQAAPIDPKPLVKVISADMALGRHDLRLAPFYVNTTTDTISQLTERLREGASRIPLAASPSAAHLTAGQLFHVALCNLATGVYTEVAAIASPMGGPAAVPGGGGGSAAAAEAEAYAAAVLRLKTALEALHQFILGTTKGFLSHGSAALWSAVKMFLTDGDRAAIDAKTRAVMGRQLLFFVKGTPQYDGARHDAGNRLILRAMALCCSVRVDGSWRDRLKAIPSALAPLCPFERLPNPTRRAFRALTAADGAEEEWGTALHPLLQIALVFSRQPEGTGVLLTTAMKETSDHLTLSIAEAISGADGTAAPLAQQVASAVAAASAGFSAADRDRLDGLVARLGGGGR